MGDNLPPDGRVSGNADLDREMFEFEKPKWEAEERYREFELKRCEDEERRKDAEWKDRKSERDERRAEREERDRKWEAQLEDCKAVIKLKEAEFELKKNEAAKQDTGVGKSKVFSDAMRSSSIRISDDPIEAVAFFMNVEQLFDAYKVPTDLKALLTSHYLNDKAKSIVSKLTPNALLHEFK